MVTSIRKGHSVLSVLFVFLAIAGGAGAVFEPMHNGEERALVCGNALRPAGKPSSVRSSGDFEKLCIAQAAMRKGPSNTIATYDHSCLSNPQVARYKILLI